MLNMFRKTELFFLGLVFNQTSIRPDKAKELAFKHLSIPENNPDRPLR